MKEALEAEKPLRDARASARRSSAASAATPFLSGQAASLLVVNMGEDQVRQARGGRWSARASSPSPPKRRARRRLRRVRAHRGGDGAALGRGRAGLPRGPRPQGAGPRPGDPDLLRAARPHLVPDRGRGRVPGLDHPPRHAGASRPRATIHSDIERGFIRAEVVAFDDLMAAGSLAACREQGRRCGSRARTTSCATAT